MRLPLKVCCPNLLCILAAEFTHYYLSCLSSEYIAAPSAASFYVSRLPDFHEDANEQPIHIYAGNLAADPDVPMLPSTTVYAHLFFVLVKARRTADKERVMFWFNVRHRYFSSTISDQLCREDQDVHLWMD